MSGLFFDVGKHIYAHRGLWSADAPENGLAAFHAAASADVGVELDVRLTADGHAIVFHDADMARLCGVPKRVDELHSREIAELRLPDGGRIPHLVDVLDILISQPVLLELKVDQTGGDRIADVVADLAASRDQPLALMSFDVATVRKLRTLAPERPVGLLIDKPAAPDDRRIARLVAHAEHIGCDYIGPHSETLPLVAQSDLPKVVWTIRDLDALNIATAHGAAPIFEMLTVGAVKSATLTRDDHHGG